MIEVEPLLERLIADFGGNYVFALDILGQYRQDRRSVDASWRGDFDPAPRPRPGAPPPPARRAGAPAPAPPRHGHGRATGARPPRRARDGDGGALEGGGA